MTTTEQAVRAAQRLARSAAGARAGADSCPYPVASTGVRAAARRAWLRMYWHLRPDEAPAADYRDDLLALAHGPDSLDDQRPAAAGEDLFGTEGTA